MNGISTATRPIPGNKSSVNFDRIVAAALFLISLLLYWYTLAPSVTFVDSGELAAVIATNGVSHPSGSPLYLLLGELIEKVPAGRFIRRLNFFSALCGAFSVAMTALAFRCYFASKKEAERKKIPKKERKRIAERLQVPDSVTISGSIAAALSLMSNVALWSTSTVTEVYALHAAFISMLAYLLCRYVSAFRGDNSSPFFLYLSAWISGLAISNYPPFGILSVPVLLLLIHTEGLKFFTQWRRNVLLLLCFAGGLLPYFLLPARAAQDPLLNWGNPSNWENFWKHVSAQQYQIFLGKPRLSLLPKALELWWDQWPALIWLLQIPGAIWLYLKQRSWFLFTLAVATINIIYVLSYDISDVSSAPSDFYVYLLPLSWCGAIWIGAFVSMFVNSVKSIRDSLLFSVACALPVIAAVPMNWQDASHRDYTYAEDFSSSILESLAPGALVLCPDWAFVSPALYLQHAENLRPDVLVLDGELLRRSWYFSYLRKRDPAFYELNRKEIDDFLRELAKYEEGRPFDPEVITKKYVTMLNGLLSSGLRSGRPPYILLNLEMKETDPQRVAQLEAALGRPPYISTGIQPHLIGYGYTWVPETPAFKLVPGPASGKLPEVKIPPRTYSPDRVYDGVTLGTIRRYAEFWRWRGEYYRKLGNCKDATHAYSRALELNPALIEAQTGLKACGGR